MVGGCGRPGASRGGLSFSLRSPLTEPPSVIEMSLIMVQKILPEWMATPADVRAFISREFRRDMTVMRNLGKLSAAQLEALAREEMRLNEIERLTANFGTSEAALTRH
jgi:hypothetical protein